MGPDWPGSSLERSSVDTQRMSWRNADCVGSLWAGLHLEISLSLLELGTNVWLKAYTIKLMEQLKDEEQ